VDVFQAHDYWVEQEGANSARKKRRGDREQSLTTYIDGK
jgi:hypothetical protein